MNLKEAPCLQGLTDPDPNIEETHGPVCSTVNLFAHEYRSLRM